MEAGQFFYLHSINFSLFYKPGGDPQSNMPSFFVDPDISIAKTIDTSIYISQKVYKEIKKKYLHPPEKITFLHFLWSEARRRGRRRW